MGRPEQSAARRRQRCVLCQNDRAQECDPPSQCRFNDLRIGLIIFYPSLGVHLSNPLPSFIRRRHQNRYADRVRYMFDLWRRLPFAAQRWKPPTDLRYVFGGCAVFFAILTAWLLGAAGSGAGRLVYLLLALAIPCLAITAWLYLLERPQASVPQDSGGTSPETERQQLLRAVNNMPIGLIMFDPGKRVLLANDCYRDMYGLSRKVTSRGRHLRELLEERLAAGNQEGVDRETYIARILELVEQTESSTRLVQLGDGRTIKIIHHCITGGGWLGTHEDVTEREKLHSEFARQNVLLQQRELQLKAQNLQFDAALKNMSQGLSMFDSERRLLVCNKQYAELYALPTELTQPGTPMESILRHCRASGRCNEEQTRERLAMASGDAPGTTIMERDDGRAMLIKHQPMPGGGFVATHEDITEQRNIEARIKHMAHHDALTDLPNRVLLREQLERALGERTLRCPIAVLWLDLDRFKEVNDTLGHATGDALLKTVAGRLQSCLRAGDTVARFGGDEFAIIQTGTNQPVGATALAARLIDVISEPCQINDHQIVVGTSVGISIAPEDADTPISC
jgi:diguanylate cyclase (GGDEF)-like protein